MINPLRYFSLLLILGSCASINTAPPTEVEGTWLGACEGTARAAATFSGDVAYFSSTSYGGASCTNAKFIFLKTSNFQVGDYVNRSGERKFNFTQSSLTVTPKTTAGVTEMNTASLCGISDWALDISRDVTGKTCNGTAQPANTTVTYSIYKLNTVASPRELQLGAASGTATGASEATRHTTVGNALVKQ